MRDASLHEPFATCPLRWSHYERHIFTRAVRRLERKHCGTWQKFYKQKTLFAELFNLFKMKDESGFPDQATTLPSLLMIIHKTCNTRLWTRNHKMYFKTLLLRTYVNVEQSEWVWLSNNGDNTNTNNIFSKSVLVAVCSPAKQHICVALMVHLF